MQNMDAGKENLGYQKQTTAETEGVNCLHMGCYLQAQRGICWMVTFVVCLHMTPSLNW